MLKLLKRIITFLIVLFSFGWKTSNTLNYIPYNVRKYNTKIINNVLYVDKELLNNYVFIKFYKNDLVLLKKKNKIKCCSSKKKEDDNLGVELENLVKDIEEGKYGADPLKLYREIENSSTIKGQEEKKEMEEQDKKINMYNVEEVINNTDESLKKSVRKAFYNTEIDENDDQNVKKEYIMMNKIEKTFDEIDDINNPEEKLDMDKIYKKINSMNDDNNLGTPFKDTAKTLLKYKGLLHMPFEQCLMLNNVHFDWRESLDHIEINIPIFEETNFEDILFHFKDDYIKLEVVRNKVKILLLDHKLCGKIAYDEAYWIITSDYKDNEKHVNLILPKLGRFKYIWEKLLQG
ncbi:conserved Plasmodium protein, unknown function [Plasmodium malariae]|uniref:CS domain-containing protein n=1 Tax=Plasmodium malariae TaxID=5858 RepID=A0A1D3SPK5_PLAMA|nr:conserved Plasmodium protein, unknown function [Plasmodium malariae]SCO93844.1 conserved Plasmodium protein, unknown function [Plasmodium malariae]